MISMDILSAKIVEQIEIYITTNRLKSDSTLANDGWIRLELLCSWENLSSYNYNTILHALCSKQSSLIELSSFEPRCIRRRRCQPLTEQSIQDVQTVVVNGLPTDVFYEELIEFFNRFYSIRDIIKIYSFDKRFYGKIHVIFNKSQDALAFVQQSKITPMYYTTNRLRQSMHGYPIVCQMFNDEHRYIRGKSFSTRLANPPSRVSKSDDHSVQLINSSICATEQILFCQNIPRKISIKTPESNRQNLALNKYSYVFYNPDDLLKQTYQCIMISVLNPFCFTVQLKQDALEFDNFQREINEFYNTIEEKDCFLTPQQIQTHLCVICSDPKSSDEKKIWNRSQILDFDPIDNTVNLFYVDLGTWDEYVPINRLRYLTEHFQRHMVFSITCRLAHLMPINHDNDSVTWAEDATKQFLAVIEHNTPEIEFLSVNSNGCFRTNLSVMNSGQYVCVNDYLIHIKKAKATNGTTDLDEDDRPNSVHSDQHEMNGHSPPIHPVIALYNRLGEVLLQSRPTSISSSSMSSPSTLSRSYVKLIHVNILTHTGDNSEQELIPIIFVQYQKSILIPDLNIVTLLQLINPMFNLQTVERYAFDIRYTCVHITQESNFDIFTQLSSFIDHLSSNSIALYPLDFVEYIFKHYNLRVASVFLALENAKHVSDLALWFTIDNELRSATSSILPSAPSTYRLPFSNRLINPT